MKNKGEDSNYESQEKVLAITTDLTEMKRSVTEYYKPLYYQQSK